MLIIIVLTLVLAGLRLWGETSNLYKTSSHTFVGGLIGYSVGIHNWFIILCVVLLCIVEIYSFSSKFFPSISIANLWKKV